MGVDAGRMLERATVAAKQPTGRIPVAAGNPEIPWSTAWVAAETGASARQLDYWIRRGLLGPHLNGRGSGSRRRWHAYDLEVVHGLARLASLGCASPWMDSAARAIRTARVDPVGERLVVLLDGAVYRHPIDQSVRASGPGWIVPLTAYPEATEEERDDAAS